MQLVFEICSICNKLINRDSNAPREKNAPTDNSINDSPLYQGDPRITEMYELFDAWRCTPCATKA